VNSTVHLNPGKEQEKCVYRYQKVTCILLIKEPTESVLDSKDYFLNCIYSATVYIVLILLVCIKYRQKGTTVIKFGFNLIQISGTNTIRTYIKREESLNPKQSLLIP
jgi:hypothetical protein